MAGLTRYIEHTVQRLTFWATLYICSFASKMVLVIQMRYLPYTDYDTAFCEQSPKLSVSYLTG